MACLNSPSSIRSFKMTKLVIFLSSIFLTFHIFLFWDSRVTEIFLLGASIVYTTCSLRDELAWWNSQNLRLPVIWCFENLDQLPGHLATVCFKKLILRNQKLAGKLRASLQKKSFLVDYFKLFNIELDRFSTGLTNDCSDRERLQWKAIK